VISTFHLPIMFGDCAWVKATQHVWKINIKMTRREFATTKCCMPAGQDEDLFWNVEILLALSKTFPLANAGQWSSSSAWPATTRSSVVVKKIWARRGIFASTFPASVSMK
jgi:hypothetical protein